MNRYLKSLFSLLIMVTVAHGAAAIAAYPDRPIRLILPFPAGGTTDTIARIISPVLGEKLSTQVVVDYRPGAATIIGAEQAVKSAPDGYTLLLATATTFTVNPILYPDLSYNPIEDFTPIGLVGTVDLVLLANNKAEHANDLTALLSNIRNHPDNYVYGSHGNGTTVHFAAEMLWSEAQVKVTHIPYKGAAPALTDLMGGQIPISFEAVPAAVAALKSGLIKPIAVTGPERASALPDVPTVAESGFPGFVMQSWFAFAGPAGLPAEVAMKLETALRDTLAEPDIQKRLSAAGVTPLFEGSARYVERIKREINMLRPIAKANQIVHNN